MVDTPVGAPAPGTHSTAAALKSAHEPIASPAERFRGEILPHARRPASERIDRAEAVPGALPGNGSPRTHLRGPPDSARLGCARALLRTVRGRQDEPREGPLEPVPQRGLDGRRLPGTGPSAQHRRPQGRRPVPALPDLASVGSPPRATPRGSTPRRSTRRGSPRVTYCSGRGTGMPGCRAARRCSGPSDRATSTCESSRRSATR